MLMYNKVLSKNDQVRLRIIQINLLIIVEELLQRLKGGSVKRIGLDQQV